MSRIDWMNGRIGTGLLVCVLVGAPASPGARAATPPTFEITFSRSVHDQPFTGRVYVFTSRRQPQPRKGPDWFHPEPFLAVDVTDWPPEQPLRISPGGGTVLTFPRAFSSTDFTGTRVQAVARLNPLERDVGTGPGNGFSAASLLGADGFVSLNIDQLVPQRRIDETQWTKLLNVRSELLSEFHQREVELKAAVTLPAGYRDHPARRYPTIFMVPGFGGTHQLGLRHSSVDEANEREVEFLRVTLDPSCPLGHHVFADSANNGPVGRALIEELIPAFDRRFRSIADPQARFLTGHSSGGWSSLWLQVTSPESFGGVWSTAPDPVDFRDFQRIDLYAPGVNMYFDEAGHRRPLAIHGGQVAVWYDNFAWMEHVLGHGGQLHSFEAVFSPRGADGKPRLLWDRNSGAVDAAVARSWESYDIRLILERNWEALQPRLAGKLHVFTGSADTFLLDGSTSLLQQSLQNLGSDAIVEIHAGRDHRSLLTSELIERMRREMATQFLSAYPKWPEAAAASRD